MYSFNDLRENYGILLQTVLLRDLSQEGMKIIKDIERDSRIYRMIAHEIAIPWTLLAVLHYRECYLSFNKHIHNGDLLWNRTVRVPAGRPVEAPRPGAIVDSEKIGYSFFHSCQDWAKLKDSTLSVPRVHGWSAESTLWFLEANNGFGYRNKGVNSPYLWAGTNHYTTGLYVEDGVYNPGAICYQLGCVPLLGYLKGLNAL